MKKIRVYIHKHEKLGYIIHNGDEVDKDFVSIYAAGVILETEIDELQYNACMQAQGEWNRSQRFLDGVFNLP